ncbi:MAG: cell division protein FtsQ/DivIB [Sodaliphilus sp.]
MKYARYIIILILTSLLLWGVLWAKGRADSEACVKVDIQIENNDSTTFVNAEGVLQYLNQCHLRLIGVPMKDINTQAVEEALARSPYLEYGECVKGADGVLIVKVKQLVPVMRVMDGDHAYYVNRDGKQMPVSTDFTSDVMIVKGHFTAQFPPKRLLPLIDYVQSDSVINALVGMIEYRDSNNIFIVPNIMGHVVNFGSVDNIENKFKKLLLFYRKVMPEKGWNTYDTISVKWQHQVVGNLRHKKVLTEHVDTVGESNENESMTPPTITSEAKTEKPDTKQQPPEKAKEKPKEATKPKAEAPKKKEPDKKKEKAKSETKKNKKK